MSGQTDLKALMEKLQGRDMAVLVNAKNEAQKKAANNPTADNIRALGYINKAIEDLVRLSRSEEDETKVFENLLTVREYLDREGWRISQSGIYKHKKEGKLTPAYDGTYHRKDVDKYARTWLRQKATGRKKQDKIDELQRLKIEKELDKLDTENARAKLKLETEQGKYVLKSNVELDLAARAGVLDAGLNYWIRTNAAGWIAQADGDANKVGEVIAFMLIGKDELINQYATVQDFEVIFEEENEDKETRTRSQGSEYGL